MKMLCSLFMIIICGAEHNSTLSLPSSENNSFMIPLSFLISHVFSELQSGRMGSAEREAEAESENWIKTKFVVL